MSATAPPSAVSAPSTPARPLAAPATVRTLARIELVRYARRPGFVLGTFLTYAALLPYLDPTEPADEFSMIVPAALLGLVGITVSARQVWASDRCAEAAGAPPVPQGTRTIAHLIACLLPFTAGLGFVALTWVRHLDVPAPAWGYTALMSDPWIAAVWVALGAVSCLGGPILGIVVARSTRWPAAPIVTSVGLVAACMVMQGLFPPLRRVRVVMPWTYWGGPFGTDDDPQRALVLSGSPQWWLVYVVALCVLGGVVALRKDPDLRARVSSVWFWGAAGGAAVACLLAMWTGVPETITSPVPASGPSWGR